MAGRTEREIYQRITALGSMCMSCLLYTSLDGQEAALEDIIGKSGHLTVTVNLKNNVHGAVLVLFHPFIKGKDQGGQDDHGADDDLRCV